MFSRDELRQLADFESRLPDEFAVTFYFQPGTPLDKSHREEGIYAKDLVRQTLQELELNGRSRGVVEDLNKILQVAEALHGNQSRGKAVFACSRRDLWKECDLPPATSGTRLFVNRRFHLKPVASLFSDNPRTWVALVDRQNARFVELDFDLIKDHGRLTDKLPRHGRSDGYAGYDGGHSERHLDDEVRRHFQSVTGVLKTAAERKQYEALVIGCNDANWPEVESQLHPDVRKKLLGRFVGELTVLSDEQAAEEGRRVTRESLSRHHKALLRETLDEAWSNGRGVTGLRRVLRATEQGEVETIFMSLEYSARAVECTNCRHLDSHLVPYCPVCGRATRPLDDVCEALVPTVVRNSLGLILLPSDEGLDRVGNIAALLRFRADQNTNRLKAVS